MRDFRVAVTSRERGLFAGAARANCGAGWLANDPHRPRYHFTAPEGWINDPNGPIYHDGVYHLFYQYRPVYANGSQSGICWGHASSTDLLHWEDWPVAMWPDSRYDVAGVYSGNTFIDDDGFPCALYTGNVGGHEETYGILARSTDGWLTWHKHKVMGNEQRPNAASPVHWDAQVWKEDGLWQQLIGGAVGEGAAQPRRRPPVDLARPGGVDPPRHHRRGPRPRSAATGSCPTWSRSAHPTAAARS